MNDTLNHFIAVCPGCSVHLRINRKYLGIRVSCNHCSRAFIAEAAQSSLRASSDEYVVGPFPSPEATSRVITVCPGCQTTLSIRRVYLGRRVVCKRCNQRFQVRENTASAEVPSASTHRPGARSALEKSGFRFLGVASPGSALDPLAAQNERLRADFQRVKSESSRHAAKYARYKSKYRQAIEQLGEVTRRLEEIQIQHGIVEPGVVMNLTEDPERFRGSTDELDDGASTIALGLESSAMNVDFADLAQDESRPTDRPRAAEAEPDRLGRASDEYVARLATRQVELDVLKQDLESTRREFDEFKARQAEAEAASVGENAKRGAEIERLRSQLDEMASEREVIQAEKDGLREYIAALRVSLDRLEEKHRSEFEKLTSEHETLRDRYQRLLADRVSTDRSSRRHEERHEELPRVPQSIHSDNGGTAVKTSQATAALVELEAARSEVKSLKERLEAVERAKRRIETAVVALGIQIK